MAVSSKKLYSCEVGTSLGSRKWECVPTLLGAGACSLSRGLFVRVWIFVLMEDAKQETNVGLLWVSITEKGEKKLTNAVKLSVTFLKCSHSLFYETHWSLTGNAYANQEKNVLEFFSGRWRKNVCIVNNISTVKNNCCLSLDTIRRAKWFAFFFTEK